MKYHRQFAKLRNSDLYVIAYTRVYRKGQAVFQFHKQILGWLLTVQQTDGRICERSLRN
ncbi:hypothetical protein WN48_06471 [Eufriesea mexicana]|uniref:Uncharacterized protein n=1 Tax=Eufriesea mexicana TaxID=516756 RepID=A0A310SSQ1_9HYME|nr:hypothetical protein WN48_06471 [Eufriesea mexicana]